MRAAASCSDDCQSLFASASDPAACVACEAASVCTSFQLACQNSPGISGPADQHPCYAVQECITTTGCARGSSTLTSCFCGALSTGDCGSAPESGPNAPHGPCAAQIKAAMGVGATNTQVLARFVGRNFPAGAAINRLNCLKNNAVCSPLCGF